ncbi:MAG: hypothetical protein ABI548_17350 [Polyangiaceae bacterium]
MTCFNSLGKRLGASLGAALLLTVACAQVDRGYDSLPSSGSAGTGTGEAGDNGNAGESSGGDAGSGTAGHAGQAAGGRSGEAGESGAAGAAGATAAPGSTLTVALDGTGAGVVGSDPVGIDCGATCMADFAPGTQVTLTATPTMGSLFSAWNGGGCSGTGTCVTTVAAATTVTATFTLTTPALTVVKAGTGTGTVTSDVAGINCGALCSAVYDYGTSVVLTATPGAGSVFTGWTGGGCIGTDPCTVPVNVATQVTAAFAILEHVTVTKSGAGTGTVTSTPTGISCGATCSAGFTYGAPVTLSAVADPNSTFAGWTGACTGTGTCVVFPTADVAVGAVFGCATGTVTYTFTGTIPTFTVPACVTALTIEAYGAPGGAAGIYTGGLGAHMKGTVVVTGGQALKYLVGGPGLAATDTAENAGASGGGGTFVVDSATPPNPLVIAGGGGGASQYGSGLNYNPGNGINAATDRAGKAPTSGIDAGGVNGLGGKTGSNSAGYMVGTGGGGLLGDGVGNADGGANYGTAITPGLAFVHGGAGGTPNGCGGATTCQPGRAGGFGGGGAAGLTGGGGGGYSGGGGGECYVVVGANGGAGGGGSYMIATATTQVLNVTSSGIPAKIIFSW